MLHHLNQIAFQGFGTILPERGQTISIDCNSTPVTLPHPPIPSPIYQTLSSTKICCVSGTAILSVSWDRTGFLDYYLDKPVWLKPGIYYSLSSFQTEACVSVTAELPPTPIQDYLSTRVFHVHNNLHIESLYTFFYHEKEQGFIFPGESHPMLELTYVDQGSLHSVVDGVDQLLEQGDLMLYGPNQWHMQYADIGVAPRFVTISFDASGQDLSSILSRKFKSPQKAVFLLEQMLREQEKADVYSNDMIISLLVQTLLTLLREGHTNNDKLQMSHTLRSENEIIRRAQQYIGSHIREKLSVPIVARSVDISPSYLTSLFHKHLQISPGEYIRRIKLQESKQMIREDTLNFTQIAAILQYSTVHHFSRQFKEHFGITPTEYAKSVR